MSKDYYKLENIPYSMVENDPELKAISKALTADLHGRFSVNTTPIEFNPNWEPAKLYDMLIISGDRAIIRDDRGWFDGFTFYIASVYYEYLQRECQKYGTSYYVSQMPQDSC